MKKLLIGGILIIFSILCNAQEYSKKELNYHPKNLNEAIAQLEKVFPDTTKSKIALMSESEFLSNTHFSTGMWIRNEWLYDRYLLGLIVVKSDLRNELFQLGLFHNDDMSALILRSFYRKLTEQVIDIEGQVADCHQYWKNVNNPQWRKEQEEKYWTEYIGRFNLGDTLVRHVYYDRNWLGSPRKNTEIEAIIKNKKERQLQIEIVSFGNENNFEVIYNEIDCSADSSWIVPNNLWKIKENE